MSVEGSNNHVEVTLPWVVEESPKTDMESSIKKVERRLSLSNINTIPPTPKELHRTKKFHIYHKRENSSASRDIFSGFPKMENS